MEDSAGQADTCLKEDSLEPLMWLKLCPHEKYFAGLVFSTSWLYMALKETHLLSDLHAACCFFLSWLGTESFFCFSFSIFQWDYKKKIPNSCLWKGQHRQYIASSQIPPVLSGKPNWDKVMLLNSLAYCTQLSKVGQFGFL